MAGAPARLSRVGFVGELGYEVHVPAGLRRGRLGRAAARRSSRTGIVPFGVEAQRLLRLEKGHLIVSQDTDGLTDPFEAHLGWAVKLDKPFFVGKREPRDHRREGAAPTAGRLRAAARCAGAAGEPPDRR